MNNILVGQEREAMNMKPGLRKFALTGSGGRSAARPADEPRL
jgi:hypothetical protein